MAEWTITRIPFDYDVKGPMLSLGESVEVCPVSERDEARAEVEELRLENQVLRRREAEVERLREALILAYDWIAGSRPHTDEVKVLAEIEAVLAELVPHSSEEKGE